MLKDNELKSLIRKAQRGDAQAKEYIVKQNFNLVRSIVARFVSRGFEWDDLFQIGCIGLVKATERFDLDLAVKFSTYAVPMIIGEIRRYIRDDNPVKVSRPVKEMAYRVRRTQDKLLGTLGREPTVAEVAKDLDITSQEVVAALEAVQPPASLFEQTTYGSSGDSVPLLDRLKYCDGPDKSHFEKIALKEVISRLPDKEKLVLLLRFFEDRTQAEIAQFMEISQVQVSRIEKRALKLIRDLLQT